ncbi:MAG: insulinase family protein, partial [Flavobacteriales bacterium]|nr:insulinase family protein [Flavobacteriales bacterium]
MVEFQEFILNNGLRVLVNQDVDTSLVAFNLVYNVGARDEEAHKTGFAHLFEHLMFGGSINIPSFDTPLQNIGGENNAFTSNDLTNYYITLPKDNLETAFWLESDRMLSLSFSEKSLSVQRQVVIEEFNQRYLNQPYGDAFLRLRPLAYKHHPYQWATIGKNIDHIKEASMEDVKGFFNRFYKPNNAVLAISGDVTVEEIKILSEKWFGEIPAGKANVNDYPQEPKQTEARREEVVSNVPLDAIYIAFHMENKLHRDYFVADLLSDILASGNSSRLFLKLVKELSFFADISCYITGDHDRGLFVISGKINPTINMKTAEAALWKELDL